MSDEKFIIILSSIMAATTAVAMWALMLWATHSC